MAPQPAAPAGDLRVRLARGYEPLHVSAEQDALLDRIAARAEAAAQEAAQRGEAALAVFDLDGCVFDTRHRQIQILRELASRAGLPELYRVVPESFVGWDLRATLVQAGIPPERAAEIFPRVRHAFDQHFFLGDYVLYDHAMPGAAALVWRCYQAGLAVVYLTGRHEEMRRGTEEALRRHGFPLARPRTHLLMKPDFHTTDLMFKAEALREMHLLGRPVIALDNEPSNVNHLAEAAPEALVVWVETDHSPRPVAPLPHLPGLRGFLYRSELPG